MRFVTVGLCALLFWAAAALTLYTGWQYTAMTFKMLDLGKHEGDET